MRNQKQSGLSSRIFLQGVLLRNPVLVQVIGLCPAVAAAADLYVSALLSVLVTGLLILCECFASLALKKVPRRARVVIYFLIGLVVCAETAFFLEQNAPELRERAADVRSGARSFGQRHDRRPTGFLRAAAARPVHAVWRVYRAGIFGGFSEMVLLCIPGAGGTDGVRHSALLA